jgi:hypothetical protein
MSAEKYRPRAELEIVENIAGSEEKVKSIFELMG